MCRGGARGLSSVLLVARSLVADFAFIAEVENNFGHLGSGCCRVGVFEELDPVTYQRFCLFEQCQGVSIAGGRHRPDFFFNGLACLAVPRGVADETTVGDLRTHLHGEDGSVEHSPPLVGFVDRALDVVQEIFLLGAIGQHGYGEIGHVVEVIPHVIAGGAWSCRAQCQFVVVGCAVVHGDTPGNTGWCGVVVLCIGAPTILHAMFGVDHLLSRFALGADHHFVLAIRECSVVQYIA